MNRTVRSVTFWILLVLIAVSLVNLLDIKQTQPLVLNYTDLVARVD